MTKIIGNPSKNNESIKKILNKPTVSEKYIFNETEFRDEILSEIKSYMSILDIGKSMKINMQKLSVKKENIGFKYF